MKAVGLHEYGGPEVLAVVELPDPPAPGPGEVLINVKAASVNHAGVALRRGDIAHLFKDAPRPLVPGMDAAGVVAVVGEGVGDRLSVGDKVMAMPGRGTCAAQKVVRENAVVRCPAGVDFTTATTLPMNGISAQLALDALELQPGQTLGVTGAVGVVGGYAIQLGKIAGLTVVADAKPEDRDAVMALGADIVVDRGDDVATHIRAEMPDGVDGFIDAAVMDDLVLPAIKDGGRLSTVRGWSGPSQRDITVLPTGVMSAPVDTALFDRLRQHVEDGTLTLRVAEVVPATEAARAHRLVEAGGLRGKVVLDLSELSKSS